MRVGVFTGQVLYRDGDRLQAVANYAANLPDVEHVRGLGFRPRLDVRALAQEIREHRLDRLVLAGDSPGHFKPGALREDGAYVEAGENDNLIVQKLQANPDALGIFGFSFLDQNADVIQGSIIEGEAPTFENIADGKYPVSRPLFFYVKKAHVGTIPGMEEYLAEFTSEKAWGPEGYLADKGMIPMPDAERKQYADAVKNLTPMAMK